MKFLNDTKHQKYTRKYFLRYFNNYKFLITSLEKILVFLVEEFFATHRKYDFSEFREICFREPNIISSKPTISSSNASTKNSMNQVS